MQEKFRNVLGASVTEFDSNFSTPEEKSNFLAGILDGILKINDSGTTGFFNKIKLAGRVEEPVLFDLEDDQAYLWLSQGKTKIYLSAFGEEKIEILTDKFFNRDLNFNKDINIGRNLTVNQDAYIFGGMRLTGNFSGSTATLSSALITGNLNINQNLTTDTATISTAYISGDLSIVGNLTGATATLSSAYITSDLIVDENVFLSSTSTLAVGYFSSPLSSKIYNFSNGTISAGTIHLGTNKFIDNGDWVEVRTFDGFDFRNLNDNEIYVSLNKQYSYFNTPLNVSGNFSGGTATLATLNVNGYFSAGTSSLGTTGLNGDLYVSNTLSTNTLWVGNGAAIFTSDDYLTVNSQNGMKFNANNLSSFEVLNSNVSRFNVTSNSVIANGYFSAGSSSLGATTINGNLSAALGTFTTLNATTASIAGNILGSSTSTFAGGFLSLPNATTQTFLGNLIGSSTSTFAGAMLSMPTVTTQTFLGNLIGNTNSTIAAQYFSNPAGTAAPFLRGLLASSIIATTSSSDIRLKSNIQDIENPLEAIKTLHPVSYNYKNFANFDETDPTRQIGFVAQEVETIYPYLVANDAIEINGQRYKGLDYSRLTALLTAGIQSQQLQIEGLSDAIGNLNIGEMQSLYDSFNTALENLSMSTEEGKLVVNSGLTVTGEALFNNATFTGDVKVGQVKVDSLENDISIDASTCVDMDGNLDSTNCDENKLNIMKNKAGNVEMFDGKVKFKPNGEVLGEKVQAKTFKNNNTSAPSGSDSCTSGEFKFAEEGGNAYIFYCTSDSNWVRSELSSY